MVNLDSLLAALAGLLNNVLDTDEVTSAELVTDFSISPVSFLNLIASFFFAELDGVLVLSLGLVLGVFLGVFLGDLRGLFRGLRRRFSNSIFLASTRICRARDPTIEELLPCKFELENVMRLRAKWLSRRPGDLPPQRGFRFLRFEGLLAKCDSKIVQVDCVSALTQRF